MTRALIILLVFSFFISGCAVNFYKGTIKDRQTISDLEGKVSKYKGEASKYKGEVDRLNELIAKETREFQKIKRDLESRIRDKRVGFEMEDRGLVITLANNILFDSGKAEVKDDASKVLGQIIKVLETSAGKKNIGIEGHTDNVPIKYSGWKSNRELSTARANNVYHYLVGNGVKPARLTTMGYGEYRPIASNDTKKGRAKNRRVEIVILPEFIKKTEGGLSEK